MILIIQNGFMTTNINRYLSEESVIIKSYDTDVSNLDLDLYSKIIILGGHQRIQNIQLYAYLLNVVSLVKKCIEINKPLLGICLGCQIIGYVLGCDIESDGKLHVGYDTKVLTFDHLFRYHYDYVVPNNMVEVLSEYDSIVYLFRHHKAYGIQCHPDIPPDTILYYHLDATCDNIAMKQTTTINENNRNLMQYLMNVLDQT